MYYKTLSTNLYYCSVTLSLKNHHFCLWNFIC